MIVGLTAINWAYSADIDPHQVWAEANAAYLAGESWNLTQDEVALANKINERYEMDDPMDGLLKRYFRCDGTSAAWTATEEILTTLEANGLRGGSTRQNSMALGAIMTKLGRKRAQSGATRTVNGLGLVEWSAYDPNDTNLYHPSLNEPPIKINS